MYKGVALVRDKDGNPKIDGDPKAMPIAMQQMLTPDEREALGLYAGPVAEDRDGVKRLKRRGDLGEIAYEAVDALNAAYVVYDNGKQIPMSQRINVPAGGTFAKEG